MFKGNLVILPSPNKQYKGKASNQGMQRMNAIMTIPVPYFPNALYIALYHIGSKHDYVGTPLLISEK